jgi:hypothetical protein
MSMPAAHHLPDRHAFRLTMPTLIDIALDMERVDHLLMILALKASRGRSEADAR